MNYKEMMIGQAKSQGRSSLNAYTIGVITAIVNNGNAGPSELNDIALALEAMDEAWDDKSLPWDYEDAKETLRIEREAI